MKKSRTIPGINIQFPWSELLITGEKKIETRRYCIPKKHIGRELALIETPGPKGKFTARIVGIIVFERSFKYKDKKHFNDDIFLHKVQDNDPNYSWVSGKEKWGWVVAKVEKFPKPKPAPYPRGIVFASNCKV